MQAIGGARLISERSRVSTLPTFTHRSAFLKDSFRAFGSPPCNSSFWLPADFNTVR